LRLGKRFPSNLVVVCATNQALRRVEIPSI
jgi:hypothetical protein